ncbi:MAG: rRNA maturation RNase YbeY [Chitinophagaceae bacterium]|nr:MAG: rRNA maturation factor [Bacteroidetes bacterium OLB11]MCC6447220.1 rRNA maturation RNase YbeY [Chitinophagaceae bacterium]HMN33041.1 rRNA maturation RNase YbeY [Chitinophagaceae bacterium]
MKNKSICKFINNGVASYLKEKEKLSKFITTFISEKSNRESHIQYIFVDDEFLLDLNQKFLQHDTLTDIITFDLSKKKTDKLEAEIYISIPRVKENATLFQVKYQHELHRVIFHGMLHLCSYNDKTPTQIAKMRKMELFCIEKYFNE